VLARHRLEQGLVDARDEQQDGDIGAECANGVNGSCRVTVERLGIDHHGIDCVARAERGRQFSRFAAAAPNDEIAGLTQGDREAVGRHGAAGGN
jgi:hypothetical protein